MRSRVFSVLPAGLCAGGLSLALALAAPALAQDSESQDAQSQAGQQQAESEAPRPAITGREARTIRLWYGTETTDTRQRLPNGIAPDVYLNAELPSGMTRRELPQGLLEQLPERPDHSYARVGDSIVLIENATGIVRGLLRNAAS